MHNHKKARAEIIQHKGRLAVAVIYADGHKDIAHEGSHGVCFKHPERIPFILRTKIVPQLLKELRYRLANGG